MSCKPSILINMFRLQKQPKAEIALYWTILTEFCAWFKAVLMNKC